MTVGEAFVALLPVWLVEGWKGRPCPVCASAVDWDKALRGVAAYITPDQILFHYPTCCNPPNPLPVEVEEAVEAAYYMETDQRALADLTEIALTPTELESAPQAKLWHPIQDDADPSPVGTAKCADRIWGHTHPGLRRWLRRPHPGEFPGWQGDPPDLVAVHCVDVSHRVRAPLTLEAVRQ